MSWSADRGRERELYGGRGTKRNGRRGGGGDVNRYVHAEAVEKGVREGRNRTFFAPLCTLG